MSALTEPESADIPEQDDQHQVIQATASIQSPLLPPVFLKEYGEVISDAPERFMAMLEKENANRRLLARWRTIALFFIGAMLIGSGTYLGGLVGAGFMSVVAIIFAWVFKSGAEES